MLQRVVRELRTVTLAIWGLTLMLAASPLAVRAADWFALGPYGGSVRAFAADPADPKHVFLSTATGWIYDSHDGGAHWERVAKLGRTEDLVIDHLLIDPSNPKRLIVGAFRFDRPDGGLFISDDGGKHWYEQAEMRGQSVRAMARSASDPRELAAGTLQGVFLSKDGGTHWKQISPAGSTELHEVESLAIDPADPNVIYAGTWHLPWKTNDGGEHWVNIKEGVIDDSDVFSIVVDVKNPQTVYASACSGIYKSKSAAELISDAAFCKRTGGTCRFAKVEGIPSAARRTRKLLMDPTNSEIVFAGTTEGLYRTNNGGAQWSRTTPDDVIINDVYVDPSHPQHVLLATDRGGVLSSDDGGDTFQPSNTGFSARQVLAYAADAQNPGTIYVGVVNDKTTGGVFQSLDGGVEWVQQSTGLGGRDVFSLASTASGTLLAGTGHGVYRLEAGTWTKSDALNYPDAPAVVPEAPAPPAQAASNGAAAPAVQAAAPPPVRAKARVVLVAVRPQAGRRAAAPSRTRADVKRTKGSLARTREPLSRTRANVRNGRTDVRRVLAKAVPRPAPALPQHHPRALRLPPTAPPPAAAPAPSQHMDAVVYGMLPLSERVYAATSAGLLLSGDDGHTWTSVASLAMPEVRFVAAQKNIVLAGGLKRLALSVDNGGTWDSLALPADLTQLSAMAVDELGNLWAGGAEGVFYSTDYGRTWKTLRNMFVTEVDGIFFDAASHRVLVTSSNSTITFAAHLPDYKVSFWETGWNLRFVRPVGDHLIGATLYDGMVLQPRMVAPGAEKASAAAAAAAPTVSTPAVSTPAVSTVAAMPAAGIAPAAPPAASALPATPPTHR